MLLCIMESFGTESLFLKNLEYQKSRHIFPFVSKCSPQSQLSNLTERINNALCPISLFPQDKAPNDSPPAATVSEPAASLGPPNQWQGPRQVTPRCSEASPAAPALSRNNIRGGKTAKPEVTLPNYLLPP